AMVVRLFRPLKLAGVHGVRWTVRLGISIDVRYADLEGRRQQGKEGGVRRRNTLACCRRTRVSASSVALALKREARIPRISLNRSVIRMRAYAVRLLRLRRIEFSVHTGSTHRPEPDRETQHSAPRKALSPCRRPRRRTALLSIAAHRRPGRFSRFRFRSARCRRRPQA